MKTKRKEDLYSKIGEKPKANKFSDVNRSLPSIDMIPGINSTSPLVYSTYKEDAMLDEHQRKMRRFVNNSKSGISMIESFSPQPQKTPNLNHNKTDKLDFLKTEPQPIILPGRNRSISKGKACLPKYCLL